MLVTDSTNVENIHNIIIVLTLYIHTHTNIFSIKFASVYVDQSVRGPIIICSLTSSVLHGTTDNVIDMLTPRIVNVYFLTA